MYSNQTKQTLDTLLEYAQRNEIMTVKSCSDLVKGCHFPYHFLCVVIGKFAFQVYCHDTGNSVRGYILTGGKPYEFINTTFWKTSGYEFNRDKWEKGAWDSSLSHAIEQLKTAIEVKENQAKKDDGLQDMKRQKQELEEKQAAEALFK